MAWVDAAAATCRPTLHACLHVRAHFSALLPHLPGLVARMGQRAVARQQRLVQRVQHVRVGCVDLDCLQAVTQVERQLVGQAGCAARAAHAARIGRAGQGVRDVQAGVAAACGGLAGCKACTRQSVVAVAAAVTAAAPHPERRAGVAALHAPDARCRGCCCTLCAPQWVLQWVKVSGGDNDECGSTPVH
jgi:hypothetical protein